MNEQLLPYIQAASCTTAVATFPDVPTSNPFFHYVQTIYQLGITSGCAGGNYCPGNPGDARADGGLPAEGQGRRRATCRRPAPASFGDVPCSSPFAPVDRRARGSRHHRRLRRRQLLPGQHGHAQADGALSSEDAVRLELRAAGACTGVFADVPCAPGDRFRRLHRGALQPGRSRAAARRRPCATARTTRTRGRRWRCSSSRPSASVLSLERSRLLQVSEGAQLLHDVALLGQAVVAHDLLHPGLVGRRPGPA